MRPHQRGHRAWQAIKEPLLLCSCLGLLFELYRFPVLKHLFCSRHLRVAEHVRVSAHELLRDAAHDVREGKQRRLAGDLTVEPDQRKEIS